MKRNPVHMLACLLAISLGTMLFPVNAVAIPVNKSPLFVASGLSPDYRVSNPRVITETKTSTDEKPGRQDSLSLASLICWHDPADMAPFEYSTMGKSCVEPTDARQRFSVQLGRRIGTDGEILGEFDGVRVDYRLSDRLKLNGIAGYPVLTTEDMVNFDRQVFGMSIATNQLGRSWDMNGYLVEQKENARIKGKSMGGVIRYLKPGRSLLAYLDYDVTDNSLGTLMASGAWRFPFKTTISATFDRRSRPIPNHQQKYLQQSMTVTEGWNWMLPADHLAIFTCDACSEVSTLGVGLSHELSTRIKLSGDVSVLETSAEAVAAQVATANSSEYSYHFRLVGKDLLLPGDRNKIDIRCNVTESGRTSIAAFDARYAITESWNIMPKLLADYHKLVHERTPRWSASPTVKMEYRQTKKTSFKIEAGGEWASGVKAVDDSRSSYFASLGYQAKF